jgi:dynactin complex subunit
MMKENIDMAFTADKPELNYREQLERHLYTINGVLEEIEEASPRPDKLLILSEKAVNLYGHLMIAKTHALEALVQVEHASAGATIVIDGSIDQTRDLQKEFNEIFREHEERLEMMRNGMRSRDGKDGRGA